MATRLLDDQLDGPTDGWFALAEAHRLPVISWGVGSRLRSASLPPYCGPRARGIARVAAEEPNVSLDTAKSVAPFGGFADVVRAAGTRKILCGSDRPWMSLTSQIGRGALAPLTEEAKKWIRGENVAARRASDG